MKKKILIISIISIILMIIIFIIYYITFNYVTKPFSGFDKGYLEGEYKYDVRFEEDFIYYYNELVNYKQYEEKYETDFYYFIGEESFMYIISILWESYAYEGYSYIIRPENEYEEVKENILNTYQFDNIRTGENAEYSIDNVTYKGWTYKHIKYEFVDYYSDYHTNVLPASLWLSYNDDKKEIVFSLIDFGSELDYLSHEQDLIEHLYLNLYH